MSSGGPIRLSPSTLGDFRRCPRCFWFAKVKLVPAPRGIFPSLPGGMDRVIKASWDACRARGERPRELAALPGALFREQALLTRWRNWRSGLSADVGGATLIGAIDDLLFDPESGLYYVLDAKTKGSAPKPGDTEKYYQLQADCYSLMLGANGFHTGDRGFFCYFWPEVGQQVDGWHCLFNTQIVEIGVDPHRAEVAVGEAVEVLGRTDPPDPGRDCEMCRYVSARSS